MNRSELKIVFEDDDILVCHKPAGIATQTKRFGQQDMESLLKNYRAQKGEPPYIGVVHRLDQPVEGVMVFAKTKQAAASLSRQVRERELGKHYLAVAPAPQKSDGVLTDYLLADRKTNLTRVVEKNTTQAQLAKLEYRVIARQKSENGPDELALYDILLHTGRHHQIRVQFSHMGCPLVGDTKYGKRSEQRGLALCAYRVEFTHPLTGKSMDFSVKPENEIFGKFEQPAE
jgi:23S rRNA pseudouridine1911/1915/1917 synthase